MSGHPNNKRDIRFLTMNKQGTVEKLDNQDLIINFILLRKSYYDLNTIKDC